MNRTYMKIWLGVFFASLIMAACGPGKAEREQKQQDELAKEVIGIHDEVMPKMGDLVKLRKRLKEKVNVWTAETGKDHTADIATAQKQIADLDAADKGMMDWMHEYNGGQGLYDHDALMAYLNEEKTKITVVKENMNAAMNAAQKFLDETGVPEAAEKEEGAIK